MSSLGPTDSKWGVHVSYCYIHGIFVVYDHNILDMHASLRLGEKVKAIRSWIMTICTVS